MLKDKKFWNDIEDMLNDEYNDFVVIDLFFTMEAYMLLKHDVSELPVNECKFYNIYHECERRLPKVLSPNTLKYISQLQTIVKDVPETSVTCAVVKVLGFVKANHDVNALFCAMGVLSGIEEATVNQHQLTILKLAKGVLLDIIKSL